MMRRAMSGGPYSKEEGRADWVLSLMLPKAGWYRLTLSNHVESAWN